MSSPKVLFGFHAVTVRLKTHPGSVAEVHFDPARRDQRMRAFIERAKEAGAKLVESGDERLTQLAGNLVGWATQPRLIIARSAGQGFNVADQFRDHRWQKCG